MEKIVSKTPKKLTKKSQKTTKERKPKTSKASLSSRPQGSENRGRWNAAEHAAFIQGLVNYGKDWKSIGAMLPSRTVVQIRTHAQKYFQKLAKKKLSNEVLDEKEEHITQFIAVKSKDSCLQKLLNKCSDFGPSGTNTGKAASSSGKGVHQGSSGTTPSKRNKGHKKSKGGNNNNKGVSLSTAASTNVAVNLSSSYKTNQRQSSNNNSSSVKKKYKNGTKVNLAHTKKQIALAASLLPQSQLKTSVAANPTTKTLNIDNHNTLSQLTDGIIPPPASITDLDTFAPVPLGLDGTLSQQGGVSHQYQVSVHGNGDDLHKFSGPPGDALLHFPSFLNETNARENQHEDTDISKPHDDVDGHGVYSEQLVSHHLSRSSLASLDIRGLSPTGIITSLDERTTVVRGGTSTTNSNHSKKRKLSGKQRTGQQKKKQLKLSASNKSPAEQTGGELNKNEIAPKSLASLESTTTSFSSIEHGTKEIINTKTLLSTNTMKQLSTKRATVRNNGASTTKSLMRPTTNTKQIINARNKNVGLPYEKSTTPPPSYGVDICTTPTAVEDRLKNATLSNSPTSIMDTNTGLFRFPDHLKGFVGRKLDSTTVVVTGQAHQDDGASDTSDFTSDGSDTCEQGHPDLDFRTHHPHKYMSGGGKQQSQSHHNPNHNHQQASSTRHYLHNSYNFPNFYHTYGTASNVGQQDVTYSPAISANASVDGGSIESTDARSKRTTGGETRYGKENVYGLKKSTGTLRRRKNAKMNMKYHKKCDPVASYDRYTSSQLKYFIDLANDESVLREQEEDLSCFAHHSVPYSSFVSPQGQTTTTNKDEKKNTNALAPVSLSEAHFDDDAFTMGLLM